MKDFRDIIEKYDVNSKVKIFIDDTLELFSTNTLASGREDKEKYELVEKEELYSLKAKNNEYKDKEKDLIDEYNLLATKYNQVLNDLATVMNTIKKTKGFTEIPIMNDRLSHEIKELYVRKLKIEEDVRLIKLKKRNLLKTLQHMEKFYGIKLPDKISQRKRNPHKQTSVRSVNN